MSNWEPDFIIFGAQRSGTSWLDLQLRKSDALCLPRYVKEVHYFDRHFAKGPEWYRRQWDPSQDHTARGIGEITPGYLHSAAARERLAKLDATRLIVQLRDPWDRIVSNIKKKMSQGSGALSAADIIAGDEQIILRSDFMGQLADVLGQAAAGRAVDVLIYEDIKEQPSSYFDRLHNAIGFEIARDDFEFGKVFGAAAQPRFKGLNQRIHDLKSGLTRHNIHWPGRVLKRMGVKRLLAAGPCIEVDQQAVKDTVRREHAGLFERIEQNAAWYRDLRQSEVTRLSKGDL